MKAPVRTAVLLGVICAALFSIGFSFRVVCPYPKNYVTRLEWLNGAPTQGMIALDCLGFIANAKGIRAPFGAVSQFDGPGKVLVMRFRNKTEVDESKLLPGDMAQFYDEDDAPVHVVAFLRPGVWTDADYRRGNVSKFNLQDKPMSDPWFSGSIRILRWKSPS